MQDAPRKKGEELPPALAAMIEDRRADEPDAPRLRGVIGRGAAAGNLA